MSCYNPRLHHFCARAFIAVMMGSNSGGEMSFDDQTLYGRSEDEMDDYGDSGLDEESMEEGYDEEEEEEELAGGAGGGMAPRVGGGGGMAEPSGSAPGGGAGAPTGGGGAARPAEEEMLVRQRRRRVPQRKRLPRKPRRRNQQRKKPRRRNQRLVAVRAERERNRLPVVARKKQARAERRNSHPWLYGREAVRRWRTSLQESCCNESVIYCAVEQSESKEKAAIYVAAFSFAECLFALDFSVCLEQR